MEYRRSAVVVLLACGLFAEAQIAAPTAEPEDSSIVEEPVAVSQSAPTEVPKEQDATQQVSTTPEAPVSLPPEESHESGKADVALQEESSESSTVKRRILSEAPTPEQIKAGKVELCKIEADAQLAELRKEEGNFSYNETSWVYGSLSGEFDVTDGVAECMYLCEDEPDCQRWVYMCGSGRGICRLHGHGGMESDEPHTYIGKSTAFEARHAAAEKRTQDAIQKAAKDREALLTQEMQDIEDAKKNAVDNAKQKLASAKQKHSGHSHGGRRLDASRDADADEDIFGEGEL